MYILLRQTRLPSKAWETHWPEVVRLKLHMLKLVAPAHEIESMITAPPDGAELSSLSSIDIKPTICGKGMKQAKMR